MLEFLSTEWASALEAAANADPAVAAALAGHPLVLAERVTALDGTTRWHHVRVAADGRVSVRLGEPDDADVVLALDEATARDVLDGRIVASDAVTAGRLRVSGDLAALPRHASALAVLADPWAAVRARTR